MQERFGSRVAYAGRDSADGFATVVDEQLTEFLGQLDSFFMATATPDGKPYIQHRGGPKGFLKVLGPGTLGFADFVGNRQYISVGRLSENDAVCLFLIDYESRTRIKIWGRARVIEDDPQLLARLSDRAYKGRVERAIVIEIEAWDINCRQHIPRKFDAADVTAAVEKLQARIRTLEAQNADLQQRLTGSGSAGQG
jgi:hypothetical protein